MKRSVGVNGVLSQIGLMKSEVILKDDLVKALCNRFEVNRAEALRAIQYAVDENWIELKNDVSYCVKSKKEQPDLPKDSDPTVMYLIVRESLNMTIGKIASQIGHACFKLAENYFGFEHYLVNCRATNEELKTYNIFNEWINNNDCTKIILVANDNEWVKLKEYYKEDENMVLIKDNGKTEVEPGSETVIGLYPMRKSEAPKLVKKLRLL